MVDISCINRYFGWYRQTGQLEKIEQLIVENLVEFANAYPDKPIIVTEYGAEAISGLHSSFSNLYSEDYQVDVLMKTHSAYDAFHQMNATMMETKLIGELVWNYADFAARPRDLTRTNGLNNKGIFNRDRQPKASAHIIRKRYLEMIERLKN